MNEHTLYMRNSRSENRQMTEILWDFLEKVDTQNEWTYYKGVNGLLRRTLNYLDRTHPGWNDPPPKFTPIETEPPSIKEVPGQWSLPPASS